MPYSRCLFLLPATCLLAQPPGQQPDPVFRAETNLALVRFHVVKNSRYVDNLKAADFLLHEDGKPRKITFFEGGSRAHRSTPLEMILLFDTSGSVLRPGLLDFLAYKHALLDGMDNVRLAVYSFDRNVRRYCKPTRDIEILATSFQALLEPRKATVRPQRIPVELVKGRKTDERGGTWLYEAIVATMRDAIAVNPSNGVTRMLVVFSDGLPTTTARPEDAAAVARELDIPIFPVLIGHWNVLERIRERQQRQMNSRNPAAPRPISNDELKHKDMEDFGSLAELTAGRSFDPREINPETLHQIIGMLQNQVVFEYIAGFSPDASQGAGRKHKLEVKLVSRENGKILGGSRTLVH
ncbi:MAG: VWA domain-containing protein [Acidobacteria bacterium]|nr:VWA domain-containing protein [Acidobacteriota bacterium]